jgi:hypothetical protein
MSDHDDAGVAAQRFARYRATYQAGGSVDFAAMEAGLTAGERDCFYSLVDVFLDQTSRRPFDDNAFGGSRVASTVRRSVRRAADARNQDQ